MEFVCKKIERLAKSEMWPGRERKDDGSDESDLLNLFLFFFLFKYLWQYGMMVFFYVLVLDHWSSHLDAKSLLMSYQFYVTVLDEWS